VLPAPRLRQPLLAGVGRLQDAAPPGRAGAGDPQACWTTLALPSLASATCCVTDLGVVGRLAERDRAQLGARAVLDDEHGRALSRLGSSSGPENSAVPSR
jgi:hypothetical protein